MRTRQRSRKEKAKERKEEEESFLVRYQNLMVRYPIGMNLLQGVLLTCLGSSAGTQISEGRIDWNDIVIMSFVNATLITPVLMVWFRELNRVSEDSQISLSVRS